MKVYYTEYEVPAGTAQALLLRTRAEGHKALSVPIPARATDLFLHKKYSRGPILMRTGDFLFRGKATRV
jgi:hypothetical protein